MNEYFMLSSFNSLKLFSGLRYLSFNYNADFNIIDIIDIVFLPVNIFFVLSISLLLFRLPGRCRRACEA